MIIVAINAVIPSIEVAVGFPSAKSRSSLVLREIKIGRLLS